MSTAKRAVAVFTLVAILVTVMALMGTAFANPPSDNGNPSCFGQFARSAPMGPGPGTVFVRPVTTAFAPGGVDELAGFVGDLNQNRPCPPPPGP